MGTRGLISILSTTLLACGPSKGADEPASTTDRAAMAMPERVVHDFERAVLTSKDAYVALFDFAAVGEMEILLHRYDLNGRLPNLTDGQAQQFSEEDGTPYTPERERRNVGNFYTFLAQRTVGTGGCSAAEPRTRYGKLLATYEPLPEDTPPKYQTLREHAVAWTKPGTGGVVGFTCTGGKGGLAVVWTKKANARGYDLITIYDD